jgi:Biotin-lipoyl like
MWEAYIGAPWTRDGTVRTYVVTMAPEVAGRIVQLPVIDNQFVHKGDCCEMATAPAATKRDLKKVLLSALQYKIPLVIGSAGSAGAKPHLDSTCFPSITACVAEPKAEPTPDAASSDYSTGCPSAGAMPTWRGGPPRRVTCGA